MNTRDQQAKKPNHIKLYADEFGIDAWVDCCAACNVPPTSASITIRFADGDVDHDDNDDRRPDTPPTVNAKVTYYRQGRKKERLAFYDLPELGERVFDAAPVLCRFDDGALEELYDAEFPISSTLDSWLAGAADKMVDDAEKLGLIAKRPDGALVRVSLDYEELDEYLRFRGIVDEEDD